MVFNFFGYIYELKKLDQGANTGCVRSTVRLPWV